MIVQAVQRFRGLGRAWFHESRLRKTAPWVRVRRQGLLWDLNMERYVDREIVVAGAFEPDTVRVLESHVRLGMHCLDVGANFGYFALLMARRVGPTGKVWAFEPTRPYRERLISHIRLNSLSPPIEVKDYGLSAAEAKVPISVGPCSATLHPTGPYPADRIENVTLRRLDDVAAEIGLTRLDFVKVDIDGHEPAFLAGAEHTLRRHRPKMVMEINQANLDAARSSAEALKEQLEAMGYRLHSEKTLEPFATREEFLRECANYSHSANVWLLPAVSKE
jgi:FkbM family methyltransferase